MADCASRKRHRTYVDRDAQKHVAGRRSRRWRYCPREGVFSDPFLPHVRKKGWAMNQWNMAIRLMNCFPGSFINHNGEFIAHLKSNTYLCLADCESEQDIMCKILEWLSRAASKGEPYRSNKANRRFQQFMQDGINQYLGTTFSHDDFDEIYTYIGNCCNYQKTLCFLESGFDMALLPTREVYSNDPRWNQHSGS